MINISSRGVRDLIRFEAQAGAVDLYLNNFRVAHLSVAAAEDLVDHLDIQAKAARSLAEVRTTTHD